MREGEIPPPPAFKESTKTTATAVTAAHMSLKVKARYELVTVVCFADTDIDFTIEITKVVCNTIVGTGRYLGQVNCYSPQKLIS